MWLRCAQQWQPAVAQLPLCIAPSQAGCAQYQPSTMPTRTSPQNVSNAHTPESTGSGASASMLNAASPMYAPDEARSDTLLCTATTNATRHQRRVTMLP